MAAKRSAKVLEWIAGSPGVFAGGAGTEEETGELDLGLRDNEIAEIHKVECDSILTEDFDAAKIVQNYNWLSMDPDSVYAATVGEDLETIVDAYHEHSSAGIHAGTEFIQDTARKFQWTFDPPVLVGTKLGMGLYGTASAGNLDAGGTAHWRVFFTRKRASDAELGRILLKRR